jgi:hypothetical protein
MSGLKPVCRVGDIGIGVCPKKGKYITTFITGDDVVSIEGKQACHIGTMGRATCGHMTIALTGSTLTRFNKGQAHRVGDIGRCTAGGIYIATTGSPMVSSE